MNKLILSLALLTMIATGCNKDPVPNPDGTFPTCIELSGTQSTPLTLTNHVVDPNVPDYCISGAYFIQADVIVEPGVTIQMKNGSKILVQNGGSFKCIGTASEKIRIRGESLTTAGQWGNIHFSTYNFDNQLIHTIVSGGGNVPTYPAMIFIGHQGSLLIDNCGFSFSSTNGFMTENTNATFVGMSNCDISLCGLYPINVDSRHVAAIDPSITGGGNTNDLIEVRSSQLQTPTTWHNISFPYHINGSLGIATDLTVIPGTNFSFADGARMEVVTDGSLNCLGTTTNNIRFYGETSTPGAWEAIVFTSSTSPLNRFEYCQFSNGGGDATYQGMITLWLNAYVRIGNSSIMNSQRYGVFNNNGTSNFIDDGNNTWGGNASGNIGT